MRTHRRPPLPLAPLLRAYAEAAPPAAADPLRGCPAGPRAAAVRSAAADWLRDDLLDSLTADDFRTALLRFYAAVVSPPLHADTLARRAALVRHGLAHLLRNADPLPVRLGRCVAADGPYFVPGVGPAFWSAAAQALNPDRHPGWTRDTLAGLRRVGLIDDRRDGPTELYAALLTAYGRILAREPGLTALHVGHFLGLVAHMRGRDLWSGADAADPLPALIRQERSRVPLRRRLTDGGKALADGRAQLLTGLKANDPGRVAAALAIADPAGTRRPIDWELHAPALLPRIDRLYHADDALAELAAFDRQAQLCGAGRWLSAAVLHLRSPHDYPVWNAAARTGLAKLDDALGDDYGIYAEAVTALCDRYRMHPLEAPAVLTAYSVLSPQRQQGRSLAGAAGSEVTAFGGFCADTFRFLAELRDHNDRGWMDRQRDRYQFAVREPLTELCRALAERYVEPVLRSAHGWDLETAARSGRALSSVVKNDYGRSVPYQDVLWITFYRRDHGGKRDDVQFFVRLSAAGVSYGLRLGREARAAGRQFRHNVQAHAEVLFDALRAGGAAERCRFGHAEDLSDAATPAGPGDLRAWAAGKSLVAAKALAPDDPLLTREELVGDVLLTLDRLLPAYACAAADDPLPLLERRAGRHRPDAADLHAEFRRATHLSDGWLKRALELLGLKRQLILQGVPGTGKTHVARQLARLLTSGREEAVRLVQFHPAYAYEEFVEGIKVRTVEVDGRREVTYPVEDGVLCAFAAEAARHPAEPFVLVIDEINRGNLPRIFGELLYLLEYRDQAVTLPYSRRSFRLPANLILLGTMNAADRSVALLDQALRRRFSFLEMPPDAAVLADWLAAHPPRAGEEFAPAVVRLFEELNARLRADLGPDRQVGHSYFMVPDLDADKLAAVWEHHVRPLLDEYFAGQPGRAAGYALPELLAGRPGPKRRAKVPET
ncbi:MAG TPA: DUF2461 family protein [Gemmataceae bacterium]|jgi:MoxR-like ATPase